MARNRRTVGNLAAVPVEQLVEQLAARGIEQAGTDLYLDVVSAVIDEDPKRVQQVLQAITMARTPATAPAMPPPPQAGPGVSGATGPAPMFAGALSGHGVGVGWRNYVGEGTGDRIAPGALASIPNDVPAQIAWVKNLVATGGQVRFAGMGHSSSDVTWGPGRVVQGRVPFGPHDPDQQGSAAVANLGADYTDPGGSLRWVSALQTVWAINRGLAAAGLTLTTMGSFDGQSLAGVLTTGTHGSGGRIGAIVDQVAAFVVVTRIPDANGHAHAAVLQIEPTAGVTDVQKFQQNPLKAGWGLVKNDAMFDAVSAAVGNMGAIVAVLIKTKPMHWIRERRGMTTWGKVRPSDFFSPTKILAAGHRRECVFVPYAGPMGPNRPYSISEAHCQVVFRDDIQPENGAPPSRPTSWVQEIVPAGGANPDQTARTQAAIFRLFPVVVGPLLKSALNGLYKKLPENVLTGWNGVNLRGWRSSVPNVLILGTGWQITASGIEVNVPLAYAKKLVDTFLTHAMEQARHQHRPFDTPCGLRFVQSGREALLPHRRGLDEPTVTLEIGRILPADQPQLRQEMWDNLRGVEKRLLDAVPFARVHWGLATPELSPGDFDTFYPNRVVDAWKAARATLDPWRAFTNAWAQRMGLCGPPGDAAAVQADVVQARARLLAVAQVMPA